MLSRGSFSIDPILSLKVQMSPEIVEEGPLLNGRRPWSVV